MSQKQTKRYRKTIKKTVARENLFVVKGFLASSAKWGFFHRVRLAWRVLTGADGKSAKEKKPDGKKPGNAGKQADKTKN
jgi:hypothetical protein